MAARTALKAPTPLEREPDTVPRSALSRLQEFSQQELSQEAREPRVRQFHARMLVTRVEEWCVEAETAEEARALFAAGAGHRCSPGESIHVEVDSLLDD